LHKFVFARHLLSVIILANLFLSFATFKSSAENTSSISFVIENDGMLGKDQGYTSGLFLGYSAASSYSLEKFAPVGIKQLAKILPLDEKNKQLWQILAGQKIWTPVEINTLNEQSDSRPYAGLLFVDLHLIEYSSEFSNKYTFMTGTVGAHSYAQKAQKLLHEVIGSKEPLGWDRQINNQWVYSLGYEKQQLLRRKKVNSVYDYDLSWTARVNVGNEKSEVALGGIYRWGVNLGDNFGSVGFTPGSYVNSGYFSTSGSGSFIFFGAEGRYRFNDITIEGRRPAHQYEINIKNWQASSVVGITYYQKNYGLSFNVAINLPEYEEAKENFSTTGTVDIFVRI